ncbi:DUF58 domain-containing protein [Amylibacter sp.]|nr:DUF58 domain-containing protein [Amylibacter sp.]
MLAAGAIALALSAIVLVLGQGLREAALAPWVILGAGVVLDLMMSRVPRKDVSVEIPPEMFVGETEDFVFDIAPISKGMTGKVDWPEGLSGPDSIKFADAGLTKVPVRAVRRGSWQVTRLHLIWSSRFKLFERVPTLALALDVKVVPNIRLVQSGQITSVVLSNMFGMKENRAVGEGTEFHQLRDFVTGMDVKSIDWKRSARHRNLVSRELRAERNHHVIIALDNGYLMREEIAGLLKIDHAVTAALATAWAAALGGDMVGFYAYDTRPNIFVAPKPGRAAFPALRLRTSELDYVSLETNHTLAMTELNARTPKRSLIIIFSDFVDTTTAELMVENISVLSKRHAVIFVIMRDPELENLTENAPTDMDQVAELVAAGQTLNERQLVLGRLAALGVTIVDAKPGTVTAQLISTYLDIKAREVI